MRFDKRQFIRSLFGLQFRTTVLLTSIVVAATGLTGATFLQLSERYSIDQARANASAMAKSLAVAGARPIAARDRERLLVLSEGFVSHCDLVYVLFTDVSGRLLACSQSGAGRIKPLFRSGGQKVSVEPINHPMTLSSESTTPWIDVVYPVVSYDIEGAQDMRAAPTVGFVRVGVNLGSSMARLDQMGMRVKLLAIGIALLMVPLGYEVVRHVVGPLNHMAEAAAALANGRLLTRVKEDRRDEIGDLARAFNVMSARISESHDAMVRQSNELEQRVRERTSELESVNRQLREAASRDSLTGLYNRRHFNEILGHAFAEATRYESDLTCMMIDLDNFKRVNDSLGHQAGDHLLQLTAQAIRSSIRESDIAVRYGGDEFAVLLPRTSPSEARASAERMLENFRTTIAEQMPEASIASLSIGLASRANAEPTTANEILILADEALYLAKAGGKNRITVVRTPALSGSGG